MRNPAGLRHSRAWRLTVWALRVIGLGLAAVAVGLLILLWSSGVGLTVLAVGMVVYLTGVVIAVTGIVGVYVGMAPPRPNFLQLRWYLLGDALRPRPARTGRPTGDGGRFGEGPDPMVNIDLLRGATHWTAAVRGARAMAAGPITVVAGLVVRLWSRTAGTTVLVVGIGGYLTIALFTLVEVHRAYLRVPLPRPSPSVLPQTLLRDALHGRS